MQEREKKGPFGALMPIILMGGALILFMQYMKDDSKEPSSDTSSDTSSVPRSDKSVQKNTVSPRKFSTSHDFRFREGKGREEVVETEPFLIFLSSQGARITRLYVKNHKNISLPVSVVMAQKDPISRKNGAIEITRNQGMDFQPHLYYMDPHEEQLGNPSLNSALFQITNQEESLDIGAMEIAYLLPLRFKNHRLELQKIYRFYKKENYFRQITILRNLEGRNFNFRYTVKGREVYGSLFYKLFGSVGSVGNTPAPSPGIGHYSGRFFLYKDKFKRRNSFYGSNSLGGGCGGGPCASQNSSEPYSRFFEAPNTLEFAGTSSRYFFAYSEFLVPENDKQNRPDGYLYRNAEDPSGKESFTTGFLNFRLAPRQAGRIQIGSLSLLDAKKSTPSSVIVSNRRVIEDQQGERKDALILDNKVFVGIRSLRGHSFREPSMMSSAFDVDKPNDDAEKAVYTSGYNEFFSGIQNVIVSLMRWLYQGTGNYGWCIVLIAIGFKLLTFPLSQVQVKSMRKMAEIRPEMDVINQKYAKEPQERQKKIMQLFKSHNINPLRGCLPILIQMPIFVGLFNAFSNSIELWHSPFIFWMQDLSRPDTVGTIPFLGFGLNILPLLMIGSQILYQRFTTISSDPQQKMLMYLMPVIMLFFFWSIPSGVTLYWTLQNFISIAWHLVSGFVGKQKMVATVS